MLIYGTGLTTKHAYELANDSDKYGTITFLNRTLEQYNCVSDYGDCWLYTDKRITEQMKQENDVIVAIMNTMGSDEKFSGCRFLILWLISARRKIIISLPKFTRG